MVDLIAIVVIVVGFVALVSVAIVVHALIEGWVLSILWGWFMVPTLGLPVISVPQAIGIALVINMLTHQSYNHHTEDKDVSTGKKIGRIVRLFTMPFSALLISWIVKMFM